MFQKFLNFFRKSTKKTNFVLFDGDQATPNVFRAFHRPEMTDVKYAFLTVSTVPNVVKESGVDLFVPRHIGKESVDMMINTLIVKECITNPDLKNVIVVSADGDMLGMMINLSEMFPNVTFTQMCQSSKFMAKRAMMATHSLPDNVKFNRFKVKTK